MDVVRIKLWGGRFAPEIFFAPPTAQTAPGGIFIGGGGKIVKNLILYNNSWIQLSGNVRLSCRGGVRFTPILLHIKDVKIVPIAALFGVEHIRNTRRVSHYLLTLEPPGHRLRSQFGWVHLSKRLLCLVLKHMSAHMMYAVPYNTKPT